LQGVIFVAVPKGENDYGQGKRLTVLERDIDDEDLPEILNRNVTLRLPESMKVGDVGRVVVWCPKYEVSFGRVDLTQAHEEEPTLNLIEVGPFIETEHGVGGTVYIQNKSMLVIRDFNYDGQVKN
jgi:hypothetical protein